MTAAESFARWSWRTTEALTRGELTRDEYVTLGYLVAKIAHDLFRRPAAERVLVTELAIVKAETSWTKTTARLGQVLASLVEKGWIETRTRTGSSKWEIWLTGAAIIETDSEATKSEAQDFELSSKRRERRTRASLGTETRGGVGEPRNGEGSLEVDVEVEKTELLEEGSERLPLEVAIEPANPLPDVLEAVERGRLARERESEHDRLRTQLGDEQFEMYRDALSAMRRRSGAA